MLMLDLKRAEERADASDKLCALKSAISQKYGADKAKKIIKSITDAIRGLCDYEEKGSEVWMFGVDTTPQDTTDYWEE